MAQKTYTITEASQLLGVSTQLLRRWERQGILIPLRTDGGHRRYDKGVIDHWVRKALNNPESQISRKNKRELANIKRSLAEKRRIIQLLLESEGRYRDLVETSHDLIWQTDAEGRFTYLNAAAHEIFGLSPKNLIGRCFFGFEADAAHVPNRRFLSTLRRHGEVQNYVTHLTTASGEDRWIGINARISRDSEGRPLGIRGTARDVTEQHLAIRHAEYMALHDALTDLPNRQALQRRVEAALRMGQPGALVIIDIDHFKRINVAFGHGSGDRLIAGLAGILRGVARDKCGELFRFGEDLFALLLPDSLRAGALDAASAMLLAVGNFRMETAGQGGNQRVISNITASAGIAMYPFHGQDWNSLLAAAEAATHQAKDEGRGRVTVFTAASDVLRANNHRIRWSQLFSDALDHDEFILHAQPAVDLHNSRPLHLEIFPRIRDEHGNRIDPQEFNDAIDALDHAKTLDQRVMARVLTHLHNQPASSTRCLAVNVSAASVADQAWIGEFSDMVRAAGIPRNRLIVELNEKTAMENVDAALAFIERIRPLGILAALDDFGAGFSSIYFLKRFEVDYLKLGGLMTRDLADNSESLAFLRAVNALAGELQRRVIAKDVDSPALLAALKASGIGHAQGRLFGEIALLEEHRPALRRRRR